MIDIREQAVTGVVPPQQGEALIREVWPSVTVYGPVAKLGRLLMRTIVLAPVAWLMLAPFYFKKILPFLATRYRLTNRRLMICKGLKPKASKEVPLADIDEVRVVPDSVDNFYRAGTLEILSKEKVVLTLLGVPGYESFRHAILNATKAWTGKKLDPFIPAKAPGAK